MVIRQVSAWQIKDKLGGATGETLEMVVAVTGHLLEWSVVTLALSSFFHLFDLFDGMLWGGAVTYPRGNILLASTLHALPIGSSS